MRDDLILHALHAHDTVASLMQFARFHSQTFSDIVK